jgi:hypothetical protein
MIMRFRPANIRLINRRPNLPRLLLALSSGKDNGNDKNNPIDHAELTRSLHITASNSSSSSDRLFLGKLPKTGLSEMHTPVTSSSANLAIDAADLAFVGSLAIGPTVRIRSLNEN